MGHYCVMDSDFRVMLAMLSKFLKRNSKGVVGRSRLVRALKMEAGNEMSISPVMRHVQLNEKNKV